MQIPTYNGAAPVAKFFLIIRGLQLFVSIVLIGVIASFISTSSSSAGSGKPPSSFFPFPLAPAHALSFLPPLQLPSFSHVPSLNASSLLPSNHSLPPSRLTPSHSDATTKDPLIILTLTSLSTLYTLLSLPFFLSSATRGLLVMCFLDLLCLLFFSITSFILGRILHTPALSCRAVANTWNSPTTGSGVGTWESWMLQSKLNCYVGKGAWGLAVGVAVCFAATVMVLPALFAKFKRGGGGKGSV